MPKAIGQPALTCTAQQARQLLMHAQGLLDNPEGKITPKRLAQMICRMGFVQVDTINVIDRAHHLTLFSRLHGYERKTLAHLLENSRDMFEHWTHDASIIPIQWFPHWHHRFRRYDQRIRTNKWWQARIGEKPDALMQQVLQRIETDGPLLSRDFEHQWNGSAKPEDGWWGWKPQKAALEHLWRMGRLAVTKRINFQKVYDLTERVFADAVATRASEEEEHVDWACRSSLERLVIATPSELAGFWNAIDLKRARSWCEQARKRGEIIEVDVQSADTLNLKPRRSFALADVERPIKKLPEIDCASIRILSPFDPVIRDRKRAQRLFGFDYTFEAFVPAPKRMFGYYVMPLLEGDRLIGRINPKLHRDRQTLEIKGVWWEKGIKVTRQRQRKLNDAIERLATFVGANKVEIRRVGD